MDARGDLVHAEELFQVRWRIICVRSVSVMMLIVCTHICVVLALYHVEQRVLAIDSRHERTLLRYAQLLEARGEVRNHLPSLDILYLHTSCVLVVLLCTCLQTDKADEMYLFSTDAVPSSRVFSAYGTFLQNVKRNYTEAHKYYRMSTCS